MANQDSFVRKYGHRAGLVIFRMRQKHANLGLQLCRKNRRVAELEAELARYRAQFGEIG